MKVCRETNRKVIKVPIESRAGIGSSMREQKTGRTTRVCPKATGKGGCADGMYLELPDKGGPFSGITKRPPDLECCQGKTFLPQSKIKLQLFPVNEVTRMRLEKDGHHPYLELILRPQKKITSVLKHLNDKWGSSSVALNELVLFPYKMHDSMSSNRRWTLNDGDISAGAVYADIGCPAVFRLRYGWLSTEPKGADQPSTSANDLQSEVEQRCRSASTENVYDELGKQTVLATKDFRSIKARETINADAENISTGVVNLKVNFSADSFSD
ncbi:TSL-kinase interacting protein 1-like [Pyrus communis]|uniref:TSL-kinase interacting protein 1-like n=1 Tax=Pyrus communis TaxID=23211 RepID=UPI0035C155FC